jgi:tRNA A-37 threonylcarbamoyl transferase component Bud32
MSTPSESRSRLPLASNVEPFRGPAARQGPKGARSMIKGRFVLGEVIGQGVMGTVYRARDLRKAEARDRSPHVAIKIFDEDINQYPQALALLQQEARKTQLLSHPNIVSVHDFDRDGTTVYLVMELLEGESLDRLLQRKADVGVGFDEAFRIIGGICRAMVHAHGRGLLHTDFNPANAFLTRDGVVKVLDFGLARALNPPDPEEISVTAFDSELLSTPQTLAYASCEVIEGAEPEVRDDIYAVACVFYELLTGKHPFKRLSATEARRRALEPTRPPGLSRLQWQTLKQALELKREARLSSATALLAGLQSQQRSKLRPVGAAAACVVALGAVGYFANEMSYRNMSEALASGNAVRIQALLPELRDLSAERRAQVFADEAARTAVIVYFQQRVNGAVSPKQGQPDFGQARRFIADLQYLLPDSQLARTMAQHWSDREREFVSQPAAAAVTDSSLASQAPAQTTPGESAPAIAVANNSGRGSDVKLLSSGPPSTGGVAPVIEAPQANGAEPKRPKKPARVSKGRKQPESVQTGAAPSVAQSESLFVSLPVLADPAVKIAALKQTFLDQIRANETQAAIATLDELRSHSPAQDSYVTREAPRAIAQAYLRLASSAVAQGHIEDGLRLATQGHDLAPTLREAQTARLRYAEYLSIGEDIKQRDRYLATHLRYKIWRVSRQAPDEMPAVKQRWAQDFTDRINATTDQKLAARLTQMRASLFPEATKAPTAEDRLADTTPVSAQN